MRVISPLSPIFDSGLCGALWVPGATAREFEREDGQLAELVPRVCPLRLSGLGIVFTRRCPSRFSRRSQGLTASPPAAQTSHIPLEHITANANIPRCESSLVCAALSPARATIYALVVPCTKSGAYARVSRWPIAASLFQLLLQHVHMVSTRSRALEGRCAVDPTGSLSLCRRPDWFAQRAIRCRLISK